MCSAAAPSLAATWTSTFVGNRGLPGDASQSGNEWTVNGGGADVWDRSDAFQFLHQTASDNAAVTARIDDLQNTDTFAKAGVMVRASLEVVMYRDGVTRNAQAPMVILDLKPDGGVEFMARPCAGCAVMYLGGVNIGAPASLRQSHPSPTTFSAQVTSEDLSRTVDLGTVTVPMNSLAPGFAVTSHDRRRLLSASSIVRRDNHECDVPAS